MTHDKRPVPPAAEGLPPGVLDSATDGATMLDAWAETGHGRNFLAHALVQLARDGWLRQQLGDGFETVRDRDDVPEPQAPPADSPSPAGEAGTCTDACRDAPGIRGLLEHVGIDTRGRDITVDGRVVDTASQPGMSVTGYCPACGRGDAAPTADDWERERQRADRAEAELRDRVHADSADAAAGSYAQRAETAEATIVRVGKLADKLFMAGRTQVERDTGRRLLAALQPPAPAHNAGPTVREAAAQDNAHWNDKYAGEGA